MTSVLLNDIHSQLFAEFLARERYYDPDKRFQSDWYRHYRDMFGA